MDFLKEHKRKNLLPFSFTKLGTWYGYSRDEVTKERKVDEIDIICLEENSGDIIFVECKWENLSERAAEKVLFELKEKSRNVDWKNDERKEYFGIFARKIEGKNSIQKKGFFAWVLGDFKTL